MAGLLWFRQTRELPGIRPVRLLPFGMVWRAHRMEAHKWPSREMIKRQADLYIFQQIEEAPGVSLWLQLILGRESPVPEMEPKLLPLHWIVQFMLLQMQGQPGCQQALFCQTDSLRVSHVQPMVKR